MGLLRLWLWLWPGGRPLVGLHLLKLVVHVEPDPVRRAVFRHPVHTPAAAAPKTLAPLPPHPVPGSP